MAETPPREAPRAETSDDADDADRPWIRMAALAAADSTDELERCVDGLGPAESARALTHLTSDQHQQVLSTLTPESAADLLAPLAREHAADIADHLDPSLLAEILAEMPVDAEVDILRFLDPEDAEAVLAALPQGDADEARRLSAYDDDTAGGLMSTEVVTVNVADTVAEIIAHLRDHAEAYRDYHVQYVYVVDAADQLRGVLPLRDLLLAPPEVTADSLMIRDPVSVAVETRLDGLVDIFDTASYIGLPVVREGRLEGVVLRTAVMDEVGEEAYRDHLKAAGIVGGEELRSMGLFRRAGRRLSWLSINIVLNVVAASVIAAYEDTLSAVIALAVFLPIISDMSGCSGNQAVAVSMRELSIGVVQPRDVFYVWRKEVSVGLLNGVALGVLLGTVAWLWQGNPWLGLVAGSALAVNTLIAVSIGGTVPLLLRGLNIDPALASGPVLTTITDLCGFLLVLGLATSVLPHLV